MNDESESATIHGLHVEGLVNVTFHAFADGERKNIQMDGDVFEIEDTEVTLVASRE